ncbi:putative peptidoglycan glycosyltransferase FtsW [Ruminococcus sp. YE282]|uniref:FtsW/RodA/SpoVE family cell cycle protein n=1 Tax=Ruminococcus sp. YE282 TaxID=3158780 RepID=UPI000882BA4E|nr:putative peptidoglycan glycosyltransferase FtsW [Ruminococcus bromii]MEE3498649.1 putative peptidoglycan glycosyltransferase FtsW [Ruminococcus bromii]SCY36798.1 cell division protein FtsW [Ruminococcus bromii]
MAPFKKMLLKADVNKIYDEEYQREQSAKDEKFFIRPSHQRKMKNTKLFSIGMGIDLPFCIIILVLLTIGTIMMFSASYAYSYYTQGDSYYYLVRQLIFVAIGIAAMVVMSFFNYNKLHKIAPIVLGIAYFSLLLVLILPAGDGNVKRWIPMGLFNIQPSEIAKFAVILFFAHWASKYYNKMQFARYSVIPGLVIFGTIAILLYLEPHYSGIVIIAILTVLMLFIGGIQKKYLIIGFVAVAAIVGILAITGGLSYAMTRMDGWGQSLVYTDEDMWQTTWQTRNSLYAIGSGGLWGLGLGQSRQKYLYLPEPQNDFIFAIVVEELGLVGAAIILLIFALLVWRGITLSLRAKDKFGKLLGIGLTSQIGIQVVLNILVITDWLPNTGISLPFFSYGGSSLIMLLAQMGIVLSISRTANIERK